MKLEAARSTAHHSSTPSNFTQSVWWDRTRQTQDRLKSQQNTEGVYYIVMASTSNPIFLIKVEEIRIM